MTEETTKPGNALSQRVGFIGAGNMATALLRGLIRAGICSPKQLRASDPSSERLSKLAEELGFEASASNTAVARDSDIVVLAVKPQVMARVLDGIREAEPPSDRLWVSLAAGVTTEFIERGLGHDAPRVVRVMPNTPALVGEGATGIAPGKHAVESDLDLAQKMFGSVGRTALLAESQLDAITGLSGSGPAFIMLVIEALSDGGVRAGLPRTVATEFAAQTVLGAAKLLLESGEHPGQLKDAVTSPGGTTIAGIEALERHGLRAALIAAVQAATNRSRELGG